MGRQLIKVSPDEDLYIEWSSVVEAPVFIGNRAETIEHLLHDFRPDTRRYAFEHDEVERRMQRTDGTGSSGYQPFACQWDDHGEIYMQQGWMPRARMGELARRCLADMSTLPDVSDLIEPFED